MQSSLLIIAIVNAPDCYKGPKSAGISPCAKADPVWNWRFLLRFLRAHRLRRQQPGDAAGKPVNGGGELRLCWPDARRATILLDLSRGSTVAGRSVAGRSGPRRSLA